jgi:hypothetical protein
MLIDNHKEIGVHFQYDTWFKHAVGDLNVNENKFNSDNVRFKM